MPPMPEHSLLTLTAGPLRVQLAPQAGGSIARFDGSWQRAGQQGRVDWLRPASEPGLSALDPLAMASFPLVPFCNRIRDGRASFQGREIRFPPNNPSAPSPHPLHGIGWRRPWTVTARDERRAALRLDVDASEAWPWRFSAEQHYELSDERLAVTITITNRDSVAMPAGIGHHPYFPHTPGTKLTSATGAMWLADAEVMPTELARTDEVEQLREGVVLSELDLDNNFVGWEHRALVEWPLDANGPRRSLLMQAQPPLDYFVLYCPAGADHFCAEPVSQCTDWLNLMPQYGPGPLGGARVEPGATLEAKFTLTPQWD
jgi:aldose 1-epimerase